MVSKIRHGHNRQITKITKSLKQSPVNNYVTVKNALVLLSQFLQENEAEDNEKPKAKCLFYWLPPNHDNFLSDV